MELTKFPNHSIFIEQPIYTLQNHLIFEFQTKDNRLVYMKHPIFQSPNDELKLVFVQAEKFLNMWQNMQYPQEYHLSTGNEEEWRKDYKFHHAEKGFSIGRENPVPLAEVSCKEYIKRTPIYKKHFLWFNKLIGYSEEHIAECSFINGITRTIWLLANGIKLFPVYVYNQESAILLAKHAGITPLSFYDLTELNLELEKLLKGKNLYEPLSWQ
ncbi:plasmid fertility inhibition factor family protein [Rodentibacter haemolyticus]|uniref:DUF3885 domain-containing protein n=1 Tax=Rodentibacter haemolyticus TaxID=2778911 RepID=A0ABX6UZR9_9PAST|nr:hypothetical protein [Rodentibacter haemolyticus]QPB42873.1 hypothetical protein IHV77_01735 [Rodentibacter haemolyticus]